PDVNGGVAAVGDTVRVHCAYTFVSARCISAHLAATSDRAVCRLFRLAGVSCNSWSGTGGPEVKSRRADKRTPALSRVFVRSVPLAKPPVERSSRPLSKEAEVAQKVHGPPPRFIYGSSGIRSTLIRVAVIVARSPLAVRFPF